MAADAITEWLERVVIQADEEGPAGGDRPLGDGQSVHLHATEPDLGDAGEWTILGRPDGIAVDHEHGKATAALRGPARSLLLAARASAHRRPGRPGGIRRPGRLGHLVGAHAFLDR